MGVAGRHTRRERIERIFENALEMPSREREDFVGRRCANDPDAGAEVARLLRAHRKSEGLLERGAPDTVASDSGSERCGPYRILHPLGSGGMGAVFLAVREDAFMRRVALKVIRGHDRVGNALRRFESERRIMASLNHPNIAQLLDGGITDDGVPYLAMEYVEGLPLLTYCDRERLGVSERLELFRKICDAVHHAHQNLVIHRDLKSSNILVTTDGEPKLLDFGIAKVQQSTGHQPVTHPGLRALTPNCASPEQLRGEPLTTASDTFALGVLLYQLLTGRHPFSTEDSSHAAMVRAICDDSPAQPSMAVTSADQTTPGDARRWARLRGTTPGALRAHLRGDLDTIVMMALRKEPSRRYRSVEQLSSDVGRHLAAEPVLACGDGRRYRLKKFVRRHPRGMAAGTALVVSLFLATLVAGWQARIAVEARHSAAASLERAEASTAFLLGLFDVDDPRSGPADSVAASTILERGLRELDALAHHPALRGQLRAVLGRAYWNLGSYGRSAELLRDAVADLESAVEEGIDPDIDEQVAGTWAQLAEALKKTGEYGEAMGASVRAHDLRVRNVGITSAPVARSLIQIGSVEVYLGNLEAADSVTRAALALVRDRLGPGHPEVTRSMKVLAAIARRRGEIDEAEALLRAVVARRRQQNGPGSPEYATALLRLGRLLAEDRGAHREAEAIYRRALMIAGPEDPERATTMAALAETLSQQGRLDESRSYLGEAVSLRRAHFSPDHPAVADVLVGLGRIHLRLGALEQAEESYREAMQIWTFRMGPEHPAMAYGLSGLARVEMARGDLVDAEVLARQALALRRDGLETGHPLIAHSEALLGEVMAQRGEAASALVLYRSALAKLRARVRGEHRDVRRVEALMAEVQ